MKRVKRRIFAGRVCEQEVYMVADSDVPAARKKPRLRFKDEDERAAHRDGIARRAHVRAFNANFSPSSLYSTLTFDNEHEVHTFDEAKRLRANYIRRLQRRFPQAVIFAYLGRGKSTRRIHMHMVSEGIPAEVIEELWRMGDVVRIEHLRDQNFRAGAPIGQDYAGLATYLYNHWTPEQGGHHYYKSRNAGECDRKDAHECKRTYSAKNPPVPPHAPDGYAYYLTNVYITPYGYMNFRYTMMSTLTPTGRPRTLAPPAVEYEIIERRE